MWVFNPFTATLDYTNSAGGAGNTFVYNEVVNGSGTTFTLLNTPVAGLIEVKARGQGILPSLTNGYQISGAIITTTDTFAAGDITANYQY